LDHSFSANSITPLGQQFSLDMDEIVAFNCTYTPKSASVDFGIIDSDGIFYYLTSTSGSINSSIRIYLSNPLKTLIYQGFQLIECSNLM
jgi:hypothetical protein